MNYDRSKRLFKTVLVIAIAITMLFAGTPNTYAEEEGLTITILSTSDVHGRYMPWDYAIDGPNTKGSLTQISTIVNQIRQENPNTILVDAGDMIQDNSAELFKEMDPHPAILAMNAMGYDAWAMGNHEFDYGLELLDQITGQFDGAVLAGNLYRETGEQYFPSYTIVEKAGVKVGIIGMTTPMVAEFKEDTDIFQGMKFTNPTEETKQAIQALAGKVDVLIGLMHMGMENENNHPDTGVIDLAHACPELAVIFAGHMHKLHEAELVNDVLIVEPSKYGTYLSRVDLTFAKEGEKLVLKEKKGSAIPIKGVESDPTIEQIVAPFHQIARDDANTIIGELTGLDMVPADEIKGIPTVQIQETPLTNFFSEVMLHYSNGADVVAHQIDNDQAKLDRGAIRKKDIAYNYQYAGGEVTVYQMTGKDLKDYMEWAVAYFNTVKPGDVTISFNPERRASKYSTNDIFGGVKYDVDLRQPAGNRITNLCHLDGTPIGADDSIKLGVNAYRMKALIGKGGPLEGRQFQQLYSTQDETAYGEIEGRIRNLAARYIQEEHQGVYEGKLLHHWQLIGLDTNLPERQDVVELIDAGILNVPQTEDGKYTNIASINILEPVTATEVKALAEKVGAAPELFAGVEQKGQLYQQLNQYRKTGGQAVVAPVKNPVHADPAKKPVHADEVYTVQAGDVLWKIALRYNKSWQEVAEYNHLQNPHLIFPGQRILIPQD